jgi:hypothetical protein
VTLLELLALTADLSGATLTDDQTTQRTELLEALAGAREHVAEYGMDDVTALLIGLADAFAAADDVSDLHSGRVELMEALTETARAARGHRDGLRAAADERAADLAARREEMAALTADTDGTDDTDDQGQDNQAGTDSDETPDGQDSAEPVVAAGQAETPPTPRPRPTIGQPSIGQLSAHRPARHRPRRSDDQPADPRASARLYASTGGSNLVSQGDEIPTMDILTDLFGRKVQQFSGQRAFPATPIARWRTAGFPEERHIRRTDSSAAVAEKLKAAYAPAAIVASGGICNPVATDFTVPTWGDDGRVLPAALGEFGADRGGLRFATPPKLTDSAPQGASAVWTEAVDANPSGATKAIATITCLAEVEVLVDAVTTRVEVGNMQARFSPEQVEAVMKLVMVQTARTAELNLLSKITAGSTLVATQPLLGALRDFLAALDTAIAGMNYRHRMPDNQQYMVLLPDWLHEFLRIDVLREHAHDDTATPTRAVTDAMIDGWIRMRNVTPVWLRDGAPADGAAVFTGGPTAAAQTFGAQAAGAELLTFPANVQWWLFPVGTWVFLNGGELNLGIVRDSVLDSTNDFETFTETFENLAKRGIESLRLVSPLTANGQSAGITATQATPATLPSAAAAGTHGVGGNF